MIEKDDIKELQNLLTEKNINFLIGSGASYPYFKTLGNVEELLSDSRTKESSKKLIYTIFYNNAIRGNIELYNGDFTDTSKKISEDYNNFIESIVQIMQVRNSRMAPNRVNIFTTNYDLFFEKTIDNYMINNPNIFLNDGANGYYTRILSSENYHKTISLNGVFDNYQNEIPMINLIKCHGSVSWKIFNDRQIIVEKDVSILDNVESEFKKLSIEDSINELEEFIEKKDITSINEYAETRIHNINDFFNEYKNLVIINPEKDKFFYTVFQEYYYSMLRLLSYELEREQTLLIVFGFSFADEHIANLVKRSINNPELIIYIFAFSDEAEKKIKENLKLNPETRKVKIISPSIFDENIDFSHFNKILFGGR